MPQMKAFMGDSNLLVLVNLHQYDLSAGYIIPMVLLIQFAVGLLYDGNILQEVISIKPELQFLSNMYNYCPFLHCTTNTVYYRTFSL